MNWRRVEGPWVDSFGEDDDGDGAPLLVCSGPRGVDGDTGAMVCCEVELARLGEKERGEREKEATTRGGRMRGG
jgi:hypothetical protein